MGATFICLDAIWQGDVPSFRAALEEAHQGEKWVSDGNFALATFDIRLPRATQVIWLELPRLASAWRVIKRVFRKGEPHRFKGLGKVFAFIWRFDRVNRPRIEAALAEHGPDVPVLHLRGSREVEAFLASL